MNKPRAPAHFINYTLTDLRKNQALHATRRRSLWAVYNLTIKMQSFIYGGERCLWPAAGGEWDVEGNLIVLYVLACALASAFHGEIVTACGYPATDRWEYQITPTDIAVLDHNRNNASEVCAFIDILAWFRQHNMYSISYIIRVMIITSHSTTATCKIHSAVQQRICCSVEHRRVRPVIITSLNI